MAGLLLDHPDPDFNELLSILQDKKTPGRVPIVELGIDSEVLQSIHDTLEGEPWVLPPGVSGPSVVDERYYQQLINLYYRLGYDFVPLWPVWVNQPPSKVRYGVDTAIASRGFREWVDESGALIRTWEDFECFPWKRIFADPDTLEMATRFMPEGMKITLSASLFEYIYESLLGYEGFFLLIRDDPQLVEAVFNQWGQIVYEYYRCALEWDVVGAIFHADDMGFKTSTLISPADLRRWLFPWLAKYAALAHEHDKPFWIHSCGNLYRNTPSVMDDLIDLVKIDGFHSFQDNILPVAEVKMRYGDRLALMGGVDMDKLTILSGDDLRKYVRGILDSCMPSGRFALGSGNTIANYVPLQNYTIMLEEARTWKP
jgi:uroporphyrinogen decarboxylase